MFSSIQVFTFTSTQCSLLSVHCAPLHLMTEALFSFQSIWCLVQTGRVVCLHFGVLCVFA